MENKMKVCKIEDCAHRGIYMVASESTYCTNCGNKLTVAIEKGICGHNVAVDDKFCGECGVNLTKFPDIQNIKTETWDIVFPPQENEQI